MNIRDRFLFLYDLFKDNVKRKEKQVIMSLSLFFFMLSLNKSYKNRKVSLTIHCKYKYFDSTVQRAEDRWQKFDFCRLLFAVNVKLIIITSLMSPATT